MQTFVYFKGADLQHASFSHSSGLADEFCHLVFGINITFFTVFVVLDPGIIGMLHPSASH